MSGPTFHAARWGRSSDRTLSSQSRWVTWEEAASSVLVLGSSRLVGRANSFTHTCWRGAPFEVPAYVLRVFTVPWIRVFTARFGSDAYTCTATASKPFLPAAAIVCCRNVLASIF